MNRIFLLVFFLITNLSFSQIDKEAISNLIKENQDSSKFDSISKILGYKGGDKVRVSTMFSVNKTGGIDSIVARGPHSIFENEAIRLIEKLPPFDPAIVNGKPSRVRFALPIIFVIENESQRKRRIKRELKAAEKTKKH